MRELSPGKFLQTVDQCRTIALENFIEIADQLRVGRDDQGRCDLELALIQEPLGIIELREKQGTESRPVIVRSNFGFGQIVFVAVDLNIGPLKGWNGRDRLVARLLDWTLGKQVDQGPSVSTGEVRHAGYNDLSGQLRSALDQFQGVVFVPYWLVAVLVIVYLLLVGPIDYFFLRRFVKRMEWTWFTLPFIVITFCVVTYSLAQHLKGNQLQINQVEIVDVDVGSRLIRGSIWAHVYSPETSTYDFATPAKVQHLAGTIGQKSTLISWQGLPGTGLGGMSGTANVNWHMDPYAIRFLSRQSPVESTVNKLPLQIWSTKSLTVRWWSEHDFSPVAELRLQSDRQLRGRVMNPLDEDLTECYLYYAPFAYQIGRIPAGKGMEITSTTIKRNLRYRLTRKTLSEANQIMAPWDKYDLNIPRIIEMMMFHEAAGGEIYTGMSNRFQSFIDLSNQIAAGRAVLVGRVSRETTLIECNANSSSSEQWIFYRFVLPVQSSEFTRKSRLLSDAS